MPILKVVKVHGRNDECLPQRASMPILKDGWSDVAHTTEGGHGQGNMLPH